MSRNPALDRVRGLAIGLVLFTHVFPIEGTSLFQRLIIVVAPAGWIGVQMFFVLSGYLLTGILVDEKGIPRFVSKFYVRRILRSVAVYFVFLAPYSVLRPVRSFLGGICYLAFGVAHSFFVGIGLGDRSVRLVAPRPVPTGVDLRELRPDE